MARTLQLLVISASLASPAAADPGAAASPLTPDTFASLHGLIRPQPGESKWAEVPWLTSLAEARERAAREDKPIFLWRAGGGDVLGRA